MAVVLAAGICAPAAPASPAVSAGHGEYDRRALQRDTDAIRAAGVTGVLAEANSPRGRMVARGGVADLETRRPMPYNAYYRNGSSTKTFVATVALQLVGEGKLSLSDPVEKWLPGLVKNNGNDGTKVSLRHLLRQTSGLHDYVSELPLSKNYSPETYRRERFRVYRPERLVEMAMRHRPHWLPEPDEQRWSYSNTNYILVGMIIEKATGDRWEKQVHDRILEPLGLRHTYTSGTSPYVPEPHATSYEQFRPGGPLVDTTVNADSHADGSMVTTTTDMYRFLRGLLDGRLLSPARLAEMKRTVKAKEWWELEPGAEYGLGLARRPARPCGAEVWYHGGDSMGQSNIEAVSDDGRRGVSVTIPTQLGDEHAATRTVKATNKLIDNALCDGFG